MVSSSIQLVLSLFAEKTASAARVSVCVRVPLPRGLFFDVPCAYFPSLSLVMLCPTGGPAVTMSEMVRSIAKRYETGKGDKDMFSIRLFDIRFSFPLPLFCRHHAIRTIIPRRNPDIVSEDVTKTAEYPFHAWAAAVCP